MTGEVLHRRAHERAPRLRGGGTATLWCLAILSPLNAPAQDTPTRVSESEYFADIPSITSVTRLAQPKSETPAAVTVIDREMIRASGARDLTDLFRLVPGFQVANQRGHRPTVTYHGVGDGFSRRMQVLIDGRSIYGELLGHVEWNTLPLAIEDIERIEVIRGPNTVTYGANAFLSAINIVTRHAAQDSGTSINLAGGDHDIGDARVRHGMSFGAGDLRISAGYRADDGLEGLPDNHRTQFLNLRADLQPSARDTVLIQIAASNLTSQEGYTGDPVFPPRPATYSSHVEQIRWQRRLAGEDEVAVQFYHNYRELDSDYTTNPINLGPPFGVVQAPVSFDGISERFDLEFQHTSKPWTDWRFVWGAGAREDSVESPAFFSTPDKISSQSSRLFGNAEWRLTPEAVVNAGAMLEHTDDTGTDFSPRLALNYHLSADDTVRVAWSKARRMPSLFEQHGDQRIYLQNILIEHVYDSRTNLQPETMHSAELGYLGRFPHWNATLDVRLYRDRIGDFISEVTVPATDLLRSATSWRNEGEVTVEGADMELAYRPSRDSRIALTYARMHATASVVASDHQVDQSERVASVPDYSASLLAMHRFSADWSGSIAHYWVGDMLWLGGGDAMPSYRRLDLRLARRLRLDDTRGEVALVIQNAGDRYLDFSDGQFFERRVFLTLRLDFP